MRILFLAWLSASAPLGAQPGPPVLEYDAKLAFLYNFLKYVEWPPSTTSIKVCAAGHNPFGKALFDTMQDQVNGRPLAAETALDLEMMEKCNVVFVPSTAKGGYVRAARGRPILTVGESDDFLREGGIIRFVEDKGKLRFEIDVENATRAKLTISPSLLRLRHNAGVPGAR